MLCTEPESLGDHRTESASFEGQADGRKGEQLETSFAVQPDNVMVKHRDGEQNPLERAQVSEEEGKVVFKRECLALKSPSSFEGMEGPAEPHPVTPETAANGISFFKLRLGWTSKQHSEGRQQGAPIREGNAFFNRRGDERRENNYNSTSRR